MIVWSVVWLYVFECLWWWYYIATFFVLDFIYCLFWKSLKNVKTLKKSLCFKWWICPQIENSSVCWSQQNRCLPLFYLRAKEGPFFKTWWFFKVLRFLKDLKNCNFSVFHDIQNGIVSHLPSIPLCIGYKGIFSVVFVGSWILWL
jgi:hypothetical protein